MITIGIPVYNQQEYLPEAIESALAQTEKAEVIVVDDGSTDHSLEIAKSFEPRGVKVIHQVNKGLASARNTIIMNMTGDYLLPLDADDILLENCVARLSEIAKESGCDVIAPSFKNFGVHNHMVILGVIPSVQDFLSSNRLGYFSAIKKSVLLEVGGYNPKMRWGYEDWDMWIDILKRGHSLAITKDVLVLYRTKEKSMYTDALNHHEELLAQICKNHPELFI